MYLDGHSWEQTCCSRVWYGPAAALDFFTADGLDGSADTDEGEVMTGQRLDEISAPYETQIRPWCVSPTVLRILDGTVELSSECQPSGKSGR
jgi:hypothetical protein